MIVLHYKQRIYLYNSYEKYIAIHHKNQRGAFFFFCPIQFDSIFCVSSREMQDLASLFRPRFFGIIFPPRDFVIMPLEWTYSCSQAATPM